MAARHLHHYGYAPTVYYPKPSKPDLFTRLQTQLKALSIPFADADPSSSSFKDTLSHTNLIVDALFGFSFRPPVRAPFDKIIPLFGTIPVLSVDIPSSWDVESGPPEDSTFMPEYLISLTAPKPCVKCFTGRRHFVGGRFLPPAVAEKFGLDLPAYEGIDQIVEVPVGGGGKL